MLLKTWDAVYSKVEGTFVLQNIVLHFVEVDQRECRFLVAVKDKGGYFGHSIK